MQDRRRTVNTIEELLAIIPKDNQEAILLMVDLDETVITSNNTLANTTWFIQLCAHVKKFIHDDSEAMAASLAIYFEVQNQVSAIPVETKIDTIIEHLRARKVKVIAVTARSTEIAEATQRHLKEAGIDFSTQWQDVKSTEVPLGENINPAYFQEGVLFCNGYNKGHCIVAFLKMVGKRFDRAILLDDSVRNVDHVCAMNGSEHVGEFAGIVFDYLHPHLGTNVLRSSLGAFAAVHSKLSPNSHAQLERFGLLSSRGETLMRSRSPSPTRG